MEKRKCSLLRHSLLSQGCEHGNKYKGLLPMGNHRLNTINVLSFLDDHNYWHVKIKLLEACKQSCISLVTSTHYKGDHICLRISYHKKHNHMEMALHIHAHKCTMTRFVCQWSLFLVTSTTHKIH